MRYNRYSWRAKVADLNSGPLFAVYDLPSFIFHLCLIHVIHTIRSGEENSFTSLCSLEARRSQGMERRKEGKMSFDEIKYLALSNEDSDDYDDLPGYEEEAEEHEDLILEEEEGLPDTIVTETTTVRITETVPPEAPQPPAPPPAKPARVARISRPKPARAKAKKKVARPAKAAAPKAKTVARKVKAKPKS